MQKTNKISYSSVSTYLECGQKYANKYVHKIRTVNVRSPLVFGGAVDNALNVLLETKDLAKSKAEFLKRWTTTEINRETINVQTDGRVLFSKADHDPVLGDDAWSSLLVKGNLMLEAYDKKIMPRIKNVIVVQKPMSVKNEEGDEIHGYLDLIVEWEDGRILLMDNKTTSVPYPEDSAANSPQLSLYYWLEKDTYKLDAIGFFTMSKKIDLNEVKTCKTCGNVATGRHAKCDSGTGKNRCNGEWHSTYTPECEVNVIINNASEEILDRTMEEFDVANNGISNQKFEMNERSCYGKFGPCEYIKLCKRGSMENLVSTKKPEDA